MTNTQFIGNTVPEPLDRLTARLGYKVVALYYDEKNQTVKTVSPHYPDTAFNLSADSRCSYAHTDFIACSCGFYAYKTADKALQHWLSECHQYANFFIVQVALSGQVVVAENGYKASHQRITKIMMNGCWNCNHISEGFVLHENGYLAPACTKCAKNVMRPEQFTEMFSPVGFKPIIVVSDANIETAAETLQPELAKAKIVEAINKLSREGRNSEIDEIILHAKKSMFSSLNYDTIFTEQNKNKDS